jgi:hypothetical protein
MKFNKHLFLTASLILAFSAGMTSCGDDEESCSLKPADCKAEGKKLDRKACACIVSDTCTKTCKDGQKLDEDSCTCVTIKTCELTQADCEAQEKELDSVKCECVAQGTSTCSVECEAPKVVDPDKCECVDPPKCEKTCKDGENLDKDKCECVPGGSTPNPNCTTENHPCDANQELDTKKCECVAKGEAECKEECKPDEMLAPDECTCIGKPAVECDIKSCPHGTELHPGLCQCINPSEPLPCTKTDADCGANQELDKDLCQCMPAGSVCKVECDSNQHQIINKDECKCECMKGYTMTGNECQPVETCGNGTLESDEFCDTDSSGNALYHSPTDADCKKWQPGNYVGKGAPACNNTCTGYGGAGTCSTELKCGNNKLDEGEFCDMVNGTAVFQDPSKAVCSVENGFDPKQGGTPSCNVEKDCVIDKGTCSFINIASIVQGFHSCSATFTYDSASNTVNATATYDTVNPDPKVKGAVICDNSTASVLESLSVFGKTFATGVNGSISSSFNVSASQESFENKSYTCVFYIVDETYQTNDGRGAICTDKADFPDKTMGEYNATISI